MSHPIHSTSHAHVNPYRQASQTAQTPTARQAAGTGALEVKQAVPAPAAAGEADPLSKAEQQMIDRYFPPSTEMTLRLYNPGRGAHTVNPGAVGTRLDLRG